MIVQRHLSVCLNAVRNVQFAEYSIDISNYYTKKHCSLRCKTNRNPCNLIVCFFVYRVLARRYEKLLLIHSNIRRKHGML